MGNSAWTLGICGDGLAILKDGTMERIELVIDELNRISGLEQQKTEILQELSHFINKHDRLKQQNAKLAQANRLLIEALEKIAHWYDDGADFSGDTPTGYAASALKGVRDE